MSNPITATFAVITTASEAAVTAIEGGNSYLTLWRSKQTIGHSIELKEFSIARKAEGVKTIQKSLDTLSDPTYKLALEYLES